MDLQVGFDVLDLDQLRQFAGFCGLTSPRSSRSSGGIHGRPRVSYTSSSVAQKISPFPLTFANFRSAARHDLSFYDQFSSGKIVSRITSDTQDFGQLVSIITDVMSQFIESAVVAVMLFDIDWRLSLYVMALIPIAFVLTISYRSLARRATRQGMRAMANVNATIKETVSGIAIAKNFRQETSVYKDFDEANRTSYRVNVWRGLNPGACVSIFECYLRCRYSCPRIRRRLKRKSRPGNGRIVVSLHTQPGSLPFSCYEFVFILDINPKWLISRRTCFCFNRCRARRCPNS